MHGGRTSYTLSRWACGLTADRLAAFWWDLQSGSWLGTLELLRHCTVREYMELVMVCSEIPRNWCKVVCTSRAPCASSTMQIQTLWFLLDLFSLSLSTALGLFSLSLSSVPPEAWLLGSHINTALPTVLSPEPQRTSLNVIICVTLKCFLRLGWEACFKKICLWVDSGVKLASEVHALSLPCCVLGRSRSSMEGHGSFPVILSCDSNCLRHRASLLFPHSASGLAQILCCQPWMLHFSFLCQLLSFVPGFATIPPYLAGNMHSTCRLSNSTLSQKFHMLVMCLKDLASILLLSLAQWNSVWSLELASDSAWGFVRDVNS